MTWSRAAAIAALCWAQLLAAGCRNPPRQVLEVALRTDLRTMRECIAQFRGDKLRCPESLAELVAAGYLHRIPVDPITERADRWIEVKGPAGMAGCRSRLFDVRSGARGRASDATPYDTW